MAAPRAWEVWVVPFPYSDRLKEKRRPALIVSSGALLRETSLVWIAMLTSTQLQRGPRDYDIRDLARAGLPIPSRVRPGKIATVEPSRLIRRLGRLSARDRLPVFEAIREYAAIL